MDLNTSATLREAMRDKYPMPHLRGKVKTKLGQKYVCVHVCATQLLRGLVLKSFPLQGIILHNDQLGALLGKPSTTAQPRTVHGMHIISINLKYMQIQHVKVEIPKSPQSLSQV